LRLRALVRAQQVSERERVMVDRVRETVGA